jgi:hypothetical protein
MYCVAKINFFDNKITQTIIDFNGSLLEAYVAQAKEEFVEIEDFSTIEEVKQFYFDCDCQINIIKI